MVKIGIIGYGVVGKAINYTLSKHFHVVKYDKFTNSSPFSDLIKCDFVFISVPTPFNCSNNSVDLSALNESLSKLRSNSYEGVVIIKSTVAPGTCESFVNNYDLKIVFNPEFLRESTTPNEDFENQDTVVIGTDSLSIYSDVKRMFEKVLRSDASYYHTSPKEAEMIKCAQNTMLASRVALANMIYDACNENDIDYKKVKEIAFDSFKILGPYMSQVPGPDGKRGFGGKCLPKDIRAFSTVHSSELLEAIINYNDLLREDLDKFLVNFPK